MWPVMLRPPAHRSMSTTTTTLGRPAGERQIVLVVEDNGRGFDAEHIHTHDGAATQSFGLRCVKERNSSVEASRFTPQKALEPRCEPPCPGPVKAVRKAHDPHPVSR